MQDTGLFFFFFFPVFSRERRENLAKVYFQERSGVGGLGRGGAIVVESLSGISRELVHKCGGKGAKLLKPLLFFF